MPIGVITPMLQRFGMGSHSWGRENNLNAVKLSMMLHPSVKSRVAVLPGGASPGDRYLHTPTGRMCMWIDSFYDGTVTEPAQWVEMAPIVGTMLFVESEDCYYVFRVGNVWDLAVDLNAVHHPVQRELSFFAPGKIRANTDVFYYIAGMELTIEAGAPGSHAVLQVAPSGNLVFQLRHNSSTMGTVTFSTGQTEGVISVPSERIIYDALSEGQSSQAHTLRVVSPLDVLGAEGLSLTLRGKIRAID